jgi:hypothetical protein
MAIGTAHGSNRTAVKFSFFLDGFSIICKPTFGALLPSKKMRVSAEFELL